MPVDYYNPEKLSLPLPAEAERPARAPRSLARRLLRWALLATLVANSALLFYPEATTSCIHAAKDAVADSIAAAVGTPASAAKLCAQEQPLVPENGLYKQFADDLATDAFRERAVKLHSGAVQIPTESYDKMLPVGEDPRWEAFGPFHDYLLASFPLIHSTLSLTKVNTYGLVYTWKGSDESLKPLVLMAHQDVVPVHPSTVGEWTHPPYSGYYDGERIWGRGSSDDKSGLMSSMIAIETLLERDFKPARTVILSFGFDEEASGVYGAQQNAAHLREVWGDGAFAMIIDEGGGYSKQFDGVFAVPAIAEKGYLDTRVEVHAPGGHSSIPPAHTSIGMLAKLLVAFEDHPYRARLTRGTPVYEMVQCFAAHAPGMPKKLRAAVVKSARSDKALRAAEDILLKDKQFRALTGTTQAIDLIGGGVKTNALPELTWAVVNHRIDTASSVADVKKHDTKLLKALAQDFNLSYTAFGTQLSDADAAHYGTLELTDAWGTALEPAPTTPIGGAPYKLLAGTIKAAWAARGKGLAADETEISVAPGIMTGNTDTRYYWALSDHIFRYNHHGALKSAQLSGVHTVNESIDVDGFLEMIRFFNALILNADEADI